MVLQEESMRKGPWTEQEDFQLVCFVGLFGDRRWDFIAKVSEPAKAVVSGGLTTSTLVLSVARLLPTRSVSFSTSTPSGETEIGEELIDRREEEDGYSMDDIWRDIDDQSNVINQVCDQSNFECGPMSMPPWDYGEYSPWTVVEEENKVFDYGEAVALS
ncbi:Myb-related protein MYBAS1, partial [Cucurbita argyrosperma subsp. argyrosperma]